MVLTFNKNNKNIFDAIKHGKKKVETRAATEKYQKIKEGDIVTFSCEGDTFDKKVSQVYHVTSIDLLLVMYKPEDINPGLTTKEETIEMYHSFPDYKEKIEAFGLIVIELE